MRRKKSGSHFPFSIQIRKTRSSFFSFVHHVLTNEFFFKSDSLHIMLICIRVYSGTRMDAKHTISHLLCRTVHPNRTEREGRSRCSGPVSPESMESNLLTIGNPTTRSALGLKQHLMERQQQWRWFECLDRHIGLGRLCCNCSIHQRLGGQSRVRMERNFLTGPADLVEKRRRRAQHYLGRGHNIASLN